MRSVAPGNERRGKPRICVPFPATVHWLNHEGEEINVETVLDNLSSDGLYMRMIRSVKKGSRLSIKIALAAPSFAKKDALQVEGVVLRAEHKAGGVCGVAVAFNRVRFP